MRRSVAHIARACCALALSAATATAQQYSGAYTLTNPQGGAVTLVLRQGADGSLAGSMTGNGAQFQVEGMVEEGTAMGVITSAQGGVFFEATLEGTQLHLTLIDAGAGNMPDYSTARTLVLQRSGAPAGQPAPRSAPPGRAERPAPDAAAGGGGLQGRWSCQTGDGMAQLAFLSDRELVFNGERTPYELAPGVVRVPGDFGPVEYRYQLSGDQLTVTGPDGTGMRCQRQAGGAAPGRAGGAEALLEGQICAYSSSPDGGYATVYKLYFDGQGRFLYGTESSFSGDPGYAYGLNNNPNAGTYQVTGNNKGSPIHMQFPDGSTGTAYVYFVDSDNGRILEVQLNGRLYARGLCE